MMSETSKTLEFVLADTYALYLKTQNYHWNVTGPLFDSLHVFFEKQYAELAPAIDVLAERIRALGVRTPGSFRSFAALTSLDEASGDEDAKAMLDNLLRDQDIIIISIQKAIQSAEASQDPGTVDLLTQRLQVHQKNKWMLSSFVETWGF